MNREFVSVVTAPAIHPHESYWLVFQGARLLVIEKEDQTSLPLLSQPDVLELPLIRQHYLGYLQQDEVVHCYAAEVAEDVAAPTGMAFRGLRGLYGRLPDEHLWLGGRAVQIIDWDRIHIFCGRCGAKNEILGHERAKSVRNAGW